MALQRSAKLQKKIWTVGPRPQPAYFCDYTPLLGVTQGLTSVDNCRWSGFDGRPGAFGQMSAHRRALIIDSPEKVHVTVTEI